jgi:hypothetical protein
MVEDTSLVKVRKAFEKYRENAEAQIKLLKEEKAHLTINLAFYVFEDKVVHGKLSSAIKKIFDKNNFNNKRFFDIIGMRDKWLNDEIGIDSLPLEIKRMIKELTVNE